MPRNTSSIIKHYRDVFSFRARLGGISSPPINKQEILPLTRAVNGNICDLPAPWWCEAGGGPCVEWPGEPA